MIVGDVQVLLVRHGQSTWNADGRWQGSADPPLSLLGEHQAGAARDAIVHLGIQHVVTSDLERARRTGELVCPDDMEITVEPDLRERHAGEWEGLTRDEIEAGYPGYLAEHRSPPGFEDDATLLARVLPAVDTLLGAGFGDVILVVTHGGVIRTLERHLGAPDAPVPNLGGRWFRRSASERLALGERAVLIDPDVVALTVPDQL